MKIILSILLCGSFGVLKAQKIEKIFVNLYTDSLKKGTHNYINVDGLLSNGKYIPLDSTKVKFSCDAAPFQGNNLVLPANFKPLFVTIKVVLLSNEQAFKIFEMPVKQQEDPPLKTEQEVLNELRKKAKKQLSKLLSIF
ncbi:hypothetical protein ACFOWM_02520 [Ferruginibacter yonginensis]|uniref:DUF4369 domain-containing protein n=1 Tax=Ferruginibacter yonginensis TaxID=1310416 RepID=A0ABV8QN55_9BACT